jgi:hypothetical protein
MLVLGCLLVVLLAMIIPHPNRMANQRSSSKARSPQHDAAAPPAASQARVWSRPAISSEAFLSAEETVARKVSQFAGRRRSIAAAIARRLGVEMPAEVQRFFDLAEAGQWDELKTLFASLRETRQQEGSPPALRSLWGPILETYGVAEIAQEWPAQKLLDYGHAVLDSLRPGMIYVGGTDPGRFIPTLLNETSGGEQHIVLTQNALADNTYLDYIRLQHGDRMAMLTEEDSQRAFQEYLADAQKRLNHDQQFPDEPKQVRPGEDVRMTDGRLQVSGQVAVMAINEKLFQALMDKNPSVSFALEESFPFKSTYANAAPLGPIMELRIPDDQKSFTPEAAAQTIDYWRSAAGQLLADAEGSDSYVRKTYAKMAATQAALLADHHFPGEAEQAYGLATELCPSSPEAVFSYVSLLVGQKRFADAAQVAQTAVTAAPDNQQFAALLDQLKKNRN